MLIPYERRGTGTVSINSPSGEGGGLLGGGTFEVKRATFPLILLQAKAGGIPVQ